MVTMVTMVTYSLYYGYHSYHSYHGYHIIVTAMRDLVVLEGQFYGIQIC